MEWNDWSERLKDVLQLKFSPVAVTYSNEPSRDAAKGKSWVCGAIKKAASGDIINISATSSACPGGSWHLGLRRQTKEQMKVVGKFIVEGEKLFSSLSSLNRMMELSKARPPYDLAEYIIFSPLEKAEKMPDVVIFTCNAWQAARLINLVCYTDGIPLECDPSGSFCTSAVAYPLVTGRVNVTFGDVSARKLQKFTEDELFVSVPFPLMRSLVDSIEKSTAGTAKEERPPEFARMLKEAE